MASNFLDPRTQALIDEARSFKKGSTASQSAVINPPKRVTPTTTSDDDEYDPRTLALIRGGTSTKSSDDGDGFGLKSIGSAALGAVIKPLQVIDTPRRAIISGINEAVDLLPGGDKASWGDFVKQTVDPNYGFGTAFANPTGNKWADRIIGFTGDVLLDPITYLTFGGGAIAKTAALKGTQLAAREVGTAAARKGATILADEAARKAALGARQIARQGLKEAIATGDQVAIRAAEQAVRTSDDALRQATAKVAKATARRQSGRTARESTAEQVRLIRQEALAEAADETLDETQRAAAQAVASTLTDEVIGDIATKGYNAIRGEVADVLGVQSGLRLNIPGANKIVIPGTQKMSDAIGTRLVNTRLNFVNSDRGQRILDKVTPLGRAGLFDEDSVLKMRNELQKGTAKGKTAVDYVALLAADGRYRRFLNTVNAATGAKVRGVLDKASTEELNSIVEYLDVPENLWQIAPNQKQLELINAVRGLTDDFYGEANTLARSVGAEDLPYNPRYFPRAQSEDAIRWVERNSAKADEVAEGLGIDRTFMQQNFVERTLVPGKKWFGKVLTEEDLNGGVKKLNELAREARHIDGSINPAPLKFNFFTEDLAEALGRYGQKHARYVSYMNSVKSLQDPVVGALETTRPALTVGKIQENFDALRGTLAAEFTPAKIVNWNPEKIFAVRTAVDDLSRRLDANSLLGQEFNDAVVGLDESISIINREIQRGNLSPQVGALLQNEAEAYAMALRNQVDDVADKLKVTDPKRWKSVVRVAENGFSILNPERIPDIAVRNEVLDMFTNVRRLDNPKFAESAEKLLGDFNTFMKSWVTATPGFHVRNALGNTFQMIAAGANPVKASEGVKIYSKYLAFASKKANATKTPLDFIATLKVSPARKKALEEAFSSVSPGQFGEVIGEGGLGKAGFFGRATTSRTSQIAGAAPRLSRQLGSVIENAQRFALTYDGLEQGLDIASAAARTNKFMVDYTDLSKTDRVAKQIIPFWMWMSRNAPLQIENMWRNPRVYQIYMSGQRNIREEDENRFIPDYLREAGAFQIGRDVPVVGGMLAAPDFGFPGAGRPNPLTQIPTSPNEILAGVSAIPRTFLELGSGRKFFNQKDIANEYSDLTENEQKALYVISQLVPPLSTAGRYLNVTGPESLTQGDVPAALLGTRQLYGDEKQTQREDNFTRALASILGLPIRPLTRSEQRTEKKRQQREKEKKNK